MLESSQFKNENYSKNVDNYNINAKSDNFIHFNIDDQESAVNELHYGTNISHAKTDKCKNGFELRKSNKNGKSMKQSDTGLKLGCLNIRSLCSKIDQLQLFVQSHNFDVLGVNETWLDESVSESEIEIAGYSVVRKDRNRNGGGVCFYVKDSLNFHDRKDIGNGIESIWITVKQQDKLVIIGTIYRPPSANSVYYDDMLSEIQRAHDICSNVIVMGDLNYDYINDDTLSRNPVFNIEMLFNMKQLIEEPTRVTVNTKSLLDVILTSDHESHDNTTVINTPMSDHDCVYSEYKLLKSLQKQKHKVISYRDFKKFDVNCFLEELMNDPAICDLQFCENELIEKWNLFKTAFINVSRKHAPIKTMRMKDRYCPWVDKDIVKLMYERNHAKKCAVRTKSQELWQKFKQLRNRVTFETRIGVASET